jgi:acetoin utilization deacetylase AcuC-like enzyme
MTVAQVQETMEDGITKRDFLFGALGATAILALPGISAAAMGTERPRARATGAEPAAKPTALLTDPLYLMHATGVGHPETPARLTAVSDALRAQTWFKGLRSVRAKPADVDTLALVHERPYIELVRKECADGARRLSTGDTDICGRSYDVAVQAAGGVTAAVDAVMSGSAKNAFCAVRPPGHHAGRSKGMGFCIFNNVAVAARYAQRKHGVERVLIADWDVHHGNGTQEIFWADGTVFYMSTHQAPWYPSTGGHDEEGEGRGKGFTMNRPFPAGAGNREIAGAFRNDFLPAARKFKPDLTLISAGFDSQAGDPLGGFKLDDDGFRELTRVMIEIAGISGGGKLVSVLEGGYDLRGLASAVTAHVEELVKAG